MGNLPNAGCAAIYGNIKIIYNRGYAYSSGTVFGDYICLKVGRLNFAGKKLSNSYCVKRLQAVLIKITQQRRIRLALLYDLYVCGNVGLQMMSSALHGINHERPTCRISD